MSDGIYTLARIIKTVAAIVVAVIVAGILLRVLEANQDNDIVGFIDDVASWLVGPFKNIFSFDKNKVEVAVNWGLAALVYAIVAGVIASLLVRAGTGRRRGGVRRRRRGV